jgi:hypothetical protein
MTDSLVSKQRNKMFEKFADHILKESCPHCQHIVRQALIVEEQTQTHCKSCGEWLDGCDMCPESMVFLCIYCNNPNPIALSLVDFDLGDKIK